MSLAAAARDAGAQPRRYTDLVLAALVVSAVAMLIVPLPTWLVDLLLAANMALAVTLVVVSTYVGASIRISTFPTILLLMTLFRLGLNVSTTRLILADADAGEVVDSFGSFVVADNLVVGAIVFLVITIIQYVVVARGAERVAEVAARFTLDAMPGKQMAIDADVRLGIIDPADARERRTELERESQFYGAMDGAMKFVKGDALAAILITVINLIGGLIVGIAYRGMSVGEAASVYSMLSIGDGLTAQIPAFLTAMAAGLIVTRVAGRDHETPLGHDIGAQVAAHPQALLVTAILLLSLALIPGLPAIPFLTFAVLAGLLALWLHRAQRDALSGATPATLAVVDNPIDTSPIAPLVVELGPKFVDRHARDRQALETALAEMRQRLYTSTGVYMPPIAVRTAIPATPDAGTAPDIYRVRIFDFAVDENRTPPGLEALISRIESVLERHAFEFVDLPNVQKMVDDLAARQPMLVRGIIPRQLGMTRFAAILRQLVRERISINDLAAVLQAVVQCGAMNRSTAVLAEQTRLRLQRQITRQFAPDRSLSVWRLDPFIEDTLRGALERTDAGEVLALEPSLARDILAALRDAVERAADGVAPPRVVLTATDIRRYVSELLEVEFPELIVLAPAELLPVTQIHTVAVIGVC